MPVAKKGGGQALSEVPSPDLATGMALARKLRPREGKSVVRGHITAKWQREGMVHSEALSHQGERELGQGHGVQDERVDLVPAWGVGGAPECLNVLSQDSMLEPTGLPPRRGV